MGRGGRVGSQATEEHRSHETVQDLKEGAQTHGWNPVRKCDWGKIIIRIGAYQTHGLILGNWVPQKILNNGNDIPIENCTWVIGIAVGCQQDFGGVESANCSKSHMIFGTY